MPQRLYDTHRWRKERAQFLQAHPLCVYCQEQGRATPAMVVDHIIPHRGDPALFWDRRNWQALCFTCHAKAKKVEEHRGYAIGSDVNGMPLDRNHPWNMENI